MQLIKCLISLSFVIPGIFFPIHSVSSDEVSFTSQTIEIATPFGDDEHPSELIKELLQCPMMQRLQEIDQSGITRYTQDLPAYSRYDHSVGVYMLLRRYGLSEKECIAGLLHDASHTVFSHVGDKLFDDEEEPYHDRIHLWYLKQHGVDKILAKYGMSLEDIDAHNPEFTALEQELPNMCADRIEYTFRTGYLFGEICSCEIDYILQDLIYENANWYFTSADTARCFADISLHFAENLWANPEDTLGYHWCAEALKLAIASKEVAVSDILFSTDKLVLQALKNSQNPDIQTLMQRCENPFGTAKLANENESDLFLKAKFRAVDPLVSVEGKLVPLSLLDAEFASEYFQLKNTVEAGYHYKIDAVKAPN